MMNFLSLMFGVLAVVISTLGIFMNYYTHVFPDVFVRLFRYGRANISKSRVPKDIATRLEVPKSWFAHFYLSAVIFQASIVYTVVQKYIFQNTSSGSWLTNILSYVGDENTTAAVSTTTTLLVSVLFLIHLSRRLLESLFVSIYSGTKMNVLHYVLAFIHYTGASLSLIASSPGFCSKYDPEASEVQVTYLLTQVEIIGIFLFFYGNYQQYLAHQGYANLRKGKDKTVTSYDHKIPRGGLFNKVSCPNYWAEIVIYFAFALMFGFRNKTWNYCTAWVIGNQVMAGIMNHRWYQEKFGDSYPKNRKAVIPYVW